MKAHEVFESAPCYKCDGAGRIDAFSHVLGGVCFACGGTGHKLTARGKRCYQRWREALDAVALRLAAEVRAGDAVKLPGYDMRRYYRVAAVEPNCETVTFRFTLEVTVGGPLPYRSDSFGVELTAQVYIHAGERMPKFQEYA